MHVSAWMRRAALAVVLLALVGCKRDAVRVSVESLDFGAAASLQRMDVWNGDPKLDTMAVELKPSAPWIVIDPGSVSSGAPQSETEGFDRRSVTVTIDRTRLVGGRAEGSIVIGGPRAKEVSIPVYASPPYEAVGVSATALDFGPTDSTLTLDLWNANTEAGLLLIAATASEPWLRVRPGVVLSTGPDNRKALAVEVDRSQLAGGPHTAQIRFHAGGHVDKLVAVSVFQRFNAVGVSNESLDFGLDARPWEIDVWNASSQIELLGVQISVSDPWLHVDPSALSSAASSLGALDKQLVTVSIDRSGVAIGEYAGYIDLIPDRTDVMPRRIPVSFTQDANSPTGGLFIDTVQHRYSAPYLLDFSFGLHDAAGKAVVADPAAFTVTAFENGQVLAPGTEPILKRGTSRQLRADLVLDYSAFMQGQEGAIVAMEQAARDIFLNALNDDALVGVTAYYREDQNAARVANFTTDHAYLGGRINAIQGEYVNGFYSGARALDALFESLQRFSQADALNEDRYIVFLSSGRDTSSTRTVNDVVAEASARAVRIHAIGFGGNPDGTMLNALTVGTGGRRYSALRPETLGNAFSQIIDHLDGQYVLRWATLRRDSTSFAPSFRIALDTREGQYVETARYTASAHAGDVVEGQLRLVPSLAGDTATVVIRADYMPRAVTRVRLYVRSGLPFTASLVDAAADGLAAACTLTQTPDTASGGFFLDIVSPGPPARFADFGPLLRLDYAGVTGDPVPLLEDIQVDNTVYDAGQHFDIVNFD